MVFAPFHHLGLQKVLPRLPHKSRYGGIGELVLLVENS